MNHNHKFVNVHAHTIYSSNDALISIKDLVQDTKNLGHSSCFISEHGNLSSMPFFVQECEKNGMNFRIGCELYFTWKNATKEKTSFHLLVIVKNEIGYKNLIELQKLSNIPVDEGGGYYYRARVDAAMLEAHKEGLIVSSACVSGPVTSLLIRDDWMNACLVAEYFKETYENFYLECMPHKLQLQSDSNKKIIKLGKQLNIQVITSLDTHIRNQSYTEAYLANGDNRRGRTISYRDNPDVECLIDADFWSKGPEEIIQIYNSHGISEKTVFETFANTLELDKLITFKWENRHFDQPKFCDNDHGVLEKLIGRKLIEKFRGKDNISQKYKDRARHEFNVIKQMGFCSYFLILNDMIEYCKKESIKVGPGRGCLSSETKIRTKNGSVKNICDISTGDLITTIDGSKQMVVNKMEYDCDENLLNLKTYYGDFLGVSLTKDHKIYAEKSKRVVGYENLTDFQKSKRKIWMEPQGKLDWFRADELSVGDWVFVPYPKRKILNRYTIDLSKFSNGETMIHSDDFVIDYYKNVSASKLKFMYKISRYIDFDENFAKILGYFAGNGWFIKSKTNFIGICFHGDHIEKIKEVTEFFKHIGCKVNYRKHNNKNVVQLDIFSRFIYKLFKELFNKYDCKSQTKHVPEIIMNSDDNIIVSFINGLIGTDGSVHKNRVKICTSSFLMVNQVRELLLIVRIPSSIVLDDRIDKREEYKNSGTSYVLNFANEKIIGGDGALNGSFCKKIENGILLKIRKISTVKNPSNKVYDLQIENNHNYLTSSFLVHNSSAGSLLLWLLDVVKLDPIECNLLFERFLNISRTGTSPDVDVDLEPSGREKVINYLCEKYGQNRVIQTSTFSEVKTKVALKDAGKWLEIPFEEMNIITSLIPTKSFDLDGNPIEVKLHEAMELPSINHYVQKHPKLFEIAEKLEGSIRQTGIHAGACCILPEEAVGQIPFLKKKSDKGAHVMVSQWDKNMLEMVGVQKFDLLGLSSLEILAECERMTDFKSESIPMDDSKTWKFLQEAKHMLGIFQLMQPKTKKFLRDMKPTCLNDLSAINTLIRPGADSDQYFKNRKQKNIEYRFDFPEVRECLRDVYGSIIYQENIMMLANKLANFSLGEGDMLRRALEKNDTEKIGKFKEQFIKNCKYKDVAPELFDWIGANANYAFNKSHSDIYSLIGLWCAFWKSNYPKVFLVANLRHPKSNSKQSEPEYIEEFIKEAREMGINVELPKMNYAGPLAQLEEVPAVYNKERTVYYGLTGIKGISDASAEALCSIKFAKDFDDYVEQALTIKKEHQGKDGKKNQIRSVVTKAHIKALVKIGFFGDVKEHLEKYNSKFKEQESLDGDYEDYVNEALGFNWFNPIMKLYNRIDKFYQDEDKYLLLKIAGIKHGNTNGRDWMRIDGESNKGRISCFADPTHSLRKDDVIVSSFKTAKSGSVSLLAWRLVC